MDSIVKDEDFSTIVLCAARYALGRQTYMPSIVQRYIKTHIKELDDNALSVIASDITAAERMRGGLGSETIDAPGWRNLLTFINEETVKRKEQ